MTDVVSVNTFFQAGQHPGLRYFARQPIFNSKKQVFGYELLFRSGPENVFSGDQDGSTRMMLDNVLCYGLDVMVGTGKAFLNCTRESLVENLVAVLPPQSVVLEILEDIEPDDAVVTACQALKKKGYQLALDDYQPREGMQRLVALADYIKVDFLLSADAQQRNEVYQSLRGSTAIQIAEKIEDEQHFQIARNEGHGLFQGYFFSRPEVMVKRNLCSNSIHTLRLLSALYRSPMDMDEVEMAVKACPALTYRLLRLVNSGLYLVKQEIKTIKMALVMIGEEHFQRLATLAVLPGTEQGRPTNLTSLALQRAFFCELLAPYIYQAPGEQFLLGLLSLFPLLLETPMEQLVELLPLRNEIRAALLGQENPVSISLQLLHCYETGQWEGCAGRAGRTGPKEEEIAQLYLTSLQMAHEILSV
ncbi:MAG: EAL and HDOD domain-containing protein [Acidobacteriaceae bacterium]